MRRMIVIGMAVVLAGAPDVRAQTAGSAVRDRAGLFSAGAVREAEQALHDVRDESGWQVVIETVETLGGRPAAEQGIANAKALDLRGLYVLIAEKEHKVQVVPSPTARTAFTKPKVEAIVQAVTAAFKVQQFDKGLRDAVAVIRQEARAQTAASAGVADRAGLFSPEAVRKAEQSLKDVERDRGWQVVVETVETLGGRPAKDLAIDHAKARNLRGLYVLIAEKEHRVAVEPSRSAEVVFTKARVNALVDAVTAAFKTRQFDKGLLDAVALIQQDTSDTPAPAAPPVPAIANAEERTTSRARTSIPAVEAPLPAPRADPPLPAPPRADPPRPPAPTAPAGGERAAKGVSGLLVLGLLGVGAVLVIWILRSVFRSNKASQGGPASEAWGGTPAGRPVSGPPPSGPVGRPGAPGSGPGPGYGPGQGYPPGGGYGPAPSAGGGGFMAGALGGLGGAVVGNLLYDKFGRPHPQPHESPGGAVPHEGQGSPPGGVVPAPVEPGPVGGVEPPGESYDPNAGAEGDWGASEPAATESSAGGDWGGDAGGEGDWGGDTGGDAGGGGDWGGDAGGDAGGEGGW